MSNLKSAFRLSTLVLLLLFIQALFPVVCFSQDEKVEPWDTNSAVDYRKPPVDEIEAFKKNPNYNYDGNPEQLSLFQRILLKILQWLIKGMSGQSWFVYIIGGFVIIGILLLILRILKVPFSGLFSLSQTSTVSGLDMIHPAEGMTHDELEKLFRLYKSNGAFREAVRILYLMYLKNLHQIGVLRLRINKTNRDYAQEIKDEQDYKCFRKLSRLYDYVWFGQFNIAEPEFSQIEKEFKMACLPETINAMANG